MIKKFIDRIEKLTPDAWLAILEYIDRKLDDHDGRIKQLEKGYDEFDDQLDKTKAILDSQAETRKLIKKGFITAVVSGVVGYILRHLGMIG